MYLQQRTGSFKEDFFYKESNVIGPVKSFDKRTIAGKRRKLAQTRASCADHSKKSRNMDVIAMLKIPEYLQDALHPLAVTA